MAESRAHIGAVEELSAPTMKFGVVAVREFAEYAQMHLVRLLERFTELGCAPQNIVVKSVPSIYDVVIATQFLAEYTDVDGVVILMPENRLISAMPIMTGIVQLQMQWNMVITVGGEERAEHIIEMLIMQNEMAQEAAGNGMLATQDVS